MSGRLGRALRACSHRLEEQRGLDRAATTLAHLGGGLERRPSLGRALRGEWLGHALHPLMTDFPLGAWMSASLLDLFGGAGARRSAENLVAFGVLAAVPTAVTGVVEAGTGDARARRVAAVHAAVNTTALALYTASFAARRRQKWGAATALGVAGGVAATVGGYFGGHLSFVMGVGGERLTSSEPHGVSGDRLQEAQLSSEPEVDAESRRVTTPSQAEGER